MSIQIIMLQAVYLHAWPYKQDRLMNLPVKSEEFEKQEWTAKEAVKFAKYLVSKYCKIHPFNPASFSHILSCARSFFMASNTTC